MTKTKWCFLQLNICGISDHCQTAFDRYLDIHRPSICCLNETKKQLDKNAFTNYFTESAYKSRAEGVAILIRQGYMYTRLQDLETDSFDNIWILAVIDGHRTLIGTAYLRPNETELMEIFLKQRKKVLSFATKHEIDGILFMGDCNARHFFWGDSTCNRNGELLAESLSSEDSVINNGEETYLSANGSSVIDLCIMNGYLNTKLDFELNTDTTTELFTGAPQRGHVPVLVKCEESSNKWEVVSKIWLERANWNDWTTHLEVQCADLLHSTENVESRWEKIKTAVTQATSQTIPVKKSSKYSKPFWCQELTEKSSDLRKLRKKFKINSNYSNGEKLNAAKLEFTRMLSQKVSEWIHESLSSLSHQKGNSFWHNYHRIFKLKENEIGPLKKIDGTLATTEEEIAQEFKRTFFEGRHLLDRNFDEQHLSLVNEKVKLIEQNVNNEDNDWFFSETELVAAIKAIPQSNTFDNDNIHASMLRHFGPNMKTCLLDLFNECYLQSEWPWKQSRVLFIKKSGKSDYTSSSSYRPLTISSHVGKLFERMINNRLRHTLETQNLLEEEQEGFRAKRSSVRSLYRLQLEVEEVLQSKKAAALLNIDLEKAFDSVWNHGLMVKLHEAGISGKLYKIIVTFLRCRQSFIKIGNYNSNLFSIETGLPQGSVLSPTLFILFINDFIGSICPRFKFADDSALIVRAEDPTELGRLLQEAATTVQKWCNKWRMVVNGSKTEIIIFNSPKNQNPSIILNNEICKVKTSTKSLGIQIDEKLNFREHTEKVISKSKRSWNAISNKCTRKYGLTIPAQAYLYKTIILPQLLYGSPLWYHKNIHKLQNFQNTIMRSIFKHSPSPSIQTCQALIGQPPIDILCDSIAVKFVIKAKEKDDLVRRSHDLARARPQSRANHLESSLRRYSRNILDSTTINYTPRKIEDFITTQWKSRWKNCLDDCLLKNLKSSQPAAGQLSPLVFGDPYKANKICEIIIGNSLLLSNYKWQLSQCESPLCKCKKTEETPYHFLFDCQLRKDRPSQIETMNIFNSHDASDLKTFICKEMNWTG